MRGAISQTVGGLTAGTMYQLSFWWAAAQFYNLNGVTTENWTVTFGSQTQSTPTFTTASHGFDAWTQATMYFTATSATQVLSFLSIGTPNGAPPAALLDGVSLTAAPEPSTVAIMLVGLVGLTAVTWKRRKASGGRVA